MFLRQSDLSEAKISVGNAGAASTVEASSSLHLPMNSQPTPHRLMTLMGPRLPQFGSATKTCSLEINQANSHHSRAVSTQKNPEHFHPEATTLSIFVKSHNLAASIIMRFTICHQSLWRVSIPRQLGLQTLTDDAKSVDHIAQCLSRAVFGGR